MSRKWQDVMLASVAAALLAAGLWANTSGNSVQDLRPAPSFYAMR
jgi:hypothetical protein